MLFLSLKVVFYATILREMNVKMESVGPIVDSLQLKEVLGNLSDKRGKIARMLRSGEMFHLRRGLYATRRDLHPHCLAGSIYGPSYISFETALSFYGLIPEAVCEIMSATLRRSRTFENVFGRFRYNTIPKKVYPVGVERITESDIPLLIASPTKALCDRIALEPGMRSMSDVRRWAELMRLDENLNFDSAVLSDCAESYGRPSVRLLWRIVEKRGGILL